MQDSKAIIISTLLKAVLQHTLSDGMEYASF